MTGCSCSWFPGLIIILALFDMLTEATERFRMGLLVTGIVSHRYFKSFCCFQGVSK